MKFFWILFFPFVLLATVNEPMRCEILSGYRTDNVHWHLVDDVGGLSYVEKYPNLQFWENELSFQGIYRDLTFSAIGGYAALGRGSLNQTLGNLSYTTQQPQFTFSTHGYALDGTSYVGYAVNLTADRVYKVILIPLLGFSGHYERLKRAGSVSQSGTAVNASSYTTTSSFLKPLEQTWYGFLLGGRIRVIPVGRLLFDVGYQYHWLHVRLSTQMQTQVSLINPDSSFIQTDQITAKSGGNHGHSGWAKMEYVVDRFWRLGAEATINYYPSNVLAIQEKQTINSANSNIDTKFKLRWTSICVLFTISREL